MRIDINKAYVLTVHPLSDVDVEGLVNQAANGNVSRCAVDYI